MSDKVINTDTTSKATNIVLNCNRKTNEQPQVTNVTSSLCNTLGQPSRKNKLLIVQKLKMQLNKRCMSKTQI